MDTFYAATKEEIQNCTRKCIRLFHLKYLLVHHGEFRVLKDGIVLDGWKNIKWDMILDVILGYDEVLPAKTFATQTRLFFLKAAEPIKLVLIDGSTIYLYINWNFWTGLSANIKVYEKIKMIKK